MSASTNLSGKELLEFLLANKAAVMETSEENILFDIKEIMQQQIIPGERLLGFELAWDVHWNCVRIEDDQFINTDDDFAQAPETTFRVNSDGRLSGGTDDLAELRQAISQFLDDLTDTLREELRIGR
ncbi:MAG: hypothetical protein ACP5I8_15915 [Phycisphaerae bacterium]